MIRTTRAARVIKNWGRKRLSRGCAGDTKVALILVLVLITKMKNALLKCILVFG